ncbi:hypothetical protein LCGC14_2555360 [marine sediment metagenome]|uniref:Uncharacterized protein n=1 Tax=marine sediment metagenome TaxID=412755 RepID=A0A0F9CXV6_9ZZZZ|nr:hypothetical protein [bacterium]
MAWKKCYGCKEIINPHWPWGENFVRVNIWNEIIKKYCHNGCIGRTLQMITMEHYTLERYD